MRQSGSRISTGSWRGCVLQFALAATLLGCRTTQHETENRLAASNPGPDTVAPQHATCRPDRSQPSAQVCSSGESWLHTIDLAVALRLAGADNPTINLAREQIQEALAAELAARALLVPSINVGGNYWQHVGPLQSTAGAIRIERNQSLYLGNGARAIGSGTPTFPGVWLFAHLGDAAYEPLAARQRVAVRESDADGVTNSVLLDVATAYLELAGAEARLSLLQRAEADVAEIVRITGTFARTGQGAPADANRAAANAQLVRRQTREAEGQMAAASSRLARLVNLDTSVQLRTPGGSVAAVSLVADEPVEELISKALVRRPELQAQAAGIEEARTRVRQERARPWLPLLAVGYSNGVFGGGSNLVRDEFGPLTARSDLAVMAVWTAQNLGLGNHARVETTRALVGQAVEAYDVTVNRVRREVATAHAAVSSARTQVEITSSAQHAAEEGYRLETDRIALGQARPIEALDSFSQLLDARQDLLRALIAFDIAQFQLFVALGDNPLSADARSTR
jgi:outer membrane protein TolC